MTIAPVRVDVLGVVAYGELTAATRLAADADRAPHLEARVALAELAAVGLGHYARLRDDLAAAGVDVRTAMAPAAAPLDAFGRAAVAPDWTASLVLAHLGRALVADLGAELADRVDGSGPALPDPAGTAERAHDWVERAVRDACADDRSRPRLALAARRLLGEALAAAAAVLDGSPPIAAALAGDGSGDGRRAVLQRLKSRHSRRAGALGL